jgi:cation/acetate symporter
MSWGKIFRYYTATFVLFTLLLALLEWQGVLSNRAIGYVFLLVTIGVYALIGILSRTAQPDQYYVAGRGVPAIFNGMATGADWMSAASFISMAGALYATGYDGLAYVSGWTGGYVLLAVYLAPYLRKFGAYTIPDFLGQRYGGNTARVVGIVMAIGASFTYLIAQVTGVGIIMGRFLGLDFNVGVFVGLAGILVCSMLGGMRAVTWTQVAQYIILIIAYITPVAFLSVKHFGVPLPEFTYGQILQEITAIEIPLKAAGEVKKLWALPVYRTS